MVVEIWRLRWFALETGQTWVLGCSEDTGTLYKGVVSLRAWCILCVPVWYRGVVCYYLCAKYFSSSLLEKNARIGNEHWK